jgi:hypothetical protein
VLRISGRKREEDGSWRKLHNDELHGLYSSPITVKVIKSRRMRWVEHVAHMGEQRGSYRVLVGRPRHKWEGKIKMGLREIGIDGVNWIKLAQDSPMVSFREYSNEPSRSMKKGSCSLKS